MKGECKVSCLKLVAWSIAAQKGTNILSFYIFEYGAEYGAEYYILVINSISCCWCRYAKSHALLEVHTQKNIREVSHTFPNIFEYIFETPCSKVFSKTGFQRMYSVLKMQQYVLPWCRSNYRFSLNLKKQKETFILWSKSVKLSVWWGFPLVELICVVFCIE